jgi:3-phosphoshikimate 1-carboxyvinyltransferase
MKMIEPSRIDGVVKAPASKSDMQRAVAAGYLCSLSGGTLQITNATLCDDSKAVIGIIRTLGSEVVEGGAVVSVVGFKGSHSNMIDCKESGLCLRMFSSIAGIDTLSASSRKMIITGSGSLTSRPILMVEEPLKALGLDVKTNNGFTPVTLNGYLKGGTAEIDGSTTSQFLSGLLMSLPMCRQDSKLIVKDLKSKPYVEMTLALIAKFGIEVINNNFEEFIIKGNQRYKTTSYEIEGDWSGASFLLVAGALTGRAKVENLNSKSLQADKAILEVLKKAGVVVAVGSNYIEVFKQNVLTSFEFDANECPDLFPPIVALASNCGGVSTIYGAKRLQHKESNRAETLKTEFSKLGVQIDIEDDKMLIHGTCSGNYDNCLRGGVIIDSHNDHRIAMAGAVAGLKTQYGVKINNHEAVSKSYPDFFEILISLGATIK